MEEINVSQENKPVETINQRKRRWIIRKHERFDKDLSEARRQSNAAGRAFGISAFVAVGSFFKFFNPQDADDKLKTFLALAFTLGLSVYTLKLLILSLMDMSNLRSKLGDLDIDLEMLDELEKLEEEESRGSK